MTAKQFASLRVGDVIRHSNGNYHTVVSKSEHPLPPKRPIYALKGPIYWVAETPQFWTLIRRAKRKAGK